DNDPLNFKITSLPTNGVLYDGNGTGGHLITATDLAGGSYSITGNQVTYMPTAAFFGNDNFNFKVNDGTVDSTLAATVNVVVHDVTGPVITITGSQGTED